LTGLDTNLRGTNSTLLVTPFPAPTFLTVLRQSSYDFSESALVRAALREGLKIVLKRGIRIDGAGSEEGEATTSGQNSG
jgi:hypothetical protein